jgi:hypothetical protein
MTRLRHLLPPPADLRRTLRVLRQEAPGVRSNRALIVSLAPASYAAVSEIVPTNSVGTVQLKKNAVTSAKVRDFSLRPWDFKQTDLLRGPAGPQGPPSVIGEITIRQASITVPAGNVPHNGAYTTRSVQIRRQHRRVGKSDWAARTGRPSGRPIRVA